MTRAALALLVLLSACGGPTPEPTGSTCPDNSTLDYTHFAAPFMKSYCTRCHATDVVGADRHDAPPIYNFDTEAGIAFFPIKIDEESAGGPNAINRIMPNDDVAIPTDAERLQLGQWLACLIAGRGDPEPDAGVPDAAPAVDAGP